MKFNKLHSLFSSSLAAVVTLFALLGLLGFGTACAPRREANPRSPNLRESFVEPGYLMPDLAVDAPLPSIAGSFEMYRVVRIGARVMDWMDVLQEGVAPEFREQIWRRSDHMIDQPSPENPRTYNPKKIEAAFENALTLVHRSVYDVLDSRKALPKKLPHSLEMQDVIDGFRAIAEAYALASRWIALYPRHENLKKAGRDFRPWLQLRKEREGIESQVKDWPNLSLESKMLLIKKVAEACPVGGRSIEDCMSEAQGILEQPDAGSFQDWLDHVFIAGEEYYTSRFSIQRKHLDVDVQLSSEGVLTLGYKTFGIPAQILSWISSQIEFGWSNPGFHQSLNPVSRALPGVIQVNWQPGTLPFVNGPGGDIITMDSNQKLWLEITQVSMIHEFGHVIGFPDCYSEFWDEEQESFVFYVLDPENRMCAITGDTQRQHWEQIRETYASGSKFLIDLEAMGWPGY